MYVHEQGVEVNESGKNIGRFPRKSKLNYYSSKLVTEMNTMNSQGYGCYFLPNYGGYRSNEISEYRSCFVDLDIKDEILYELQKSEFEGTLQVMEDRMNELFKLLTIEQHKQYKSLFLNRIEELRNCGISPSGIIETKNGYHVYYFIHQGATGEQFTHAENLLVYCFNADTKAKNPNRILRVPGTLHLKNPNDPFTVKLLEMDIYKRYEVSSLIDSLSSLKNQNSQLLFVNKEKAGIQKTKKLEKKHGLPARRGIDYSNYEDGNIALIARGFEGLEDLKRKLGLLSDLSIRHIDRNDIRQILKQQDLLELLGLGQRFYCIFHNGTNPTSGTVYQNEEGKYYYKCHSSKCGKWYDIHNVVQKITSLDNVQVFEYLKQLYNIQEVKTDWQVRQEQLIEYNLELIERFKYDVDLQQQYKHLYKFLTTKGTMGIFKRIHYIAKEKLAQFAKTLSQFEKETNQTQNAVVFAPIAKIIEDIIIEEDLNKLDVNTTKTKAAILIFMYLLNVIGFEELPKEMKDKILSYRKKEKANSTLSHFKNTPRFYEIVSLDTDRLDEAEEMAKFYIDNELTINNFRRETLYRLCGEDEANRVFPDRKGQEFSELHDNLAIEFEKLILAALDEKGWITDSEIVQRLVIPDFNKKQAFRNTFKYKKAMESEVIDSIEIADDDSSMAKWYFNFIMDRLKICLPSIKRIYGIRKTKVNSHWRQTLNIPPVIKGSFYIREASENEKAIVSKSVSKNMDKQSLILKLKRENKSIKDIMSIVECSRPYIYKVLKESTNKNT